MTPEEIEAEYERVHKDEPLVELVIKVCEMQDVADSVGRILSGKYMEDD